MIDLVNLSLFSVWLGVSDFIPYAVCVFLVWGIFYVRRNFSKSLRGR